MTPSFSTESSSRCLFDSSQVESGLQSLAQQIITSYPTLDNVVLIGVLPIGSPLATRLASYILKQTNTRVPIGTLDVSLYRQDLQTDQSFINIETSDIPFSLKGKSVILVQDVLGNGQISRAALAALYDFDIPQSIQLAVVINSSHTTVPIVAHFSAYSPDVKPNDMIKIQLLEVDGQDQVVIISGKC